MNIISVTGGKGGTGKSTFSVLLASYYAKNKGKTLLVDLDVECPNDYILLNQKLENRFDFIYSNVPSLDKEKCIKCRKCAEVCESNAIFFPKDGYPRFILDLCSRCGACKIVCPENAISHKKEKTGEVFINKINSNFFLCTGLAQAGLEETGPIVSKTKEMAIKVAKNEGVETLIIDTAAGTHCPVINALMGSKMAYIVTEPTPMGVHDLGLIKQLCGKLGINAKIVLNKSDLGKIRKIKEGIDIKLPYSKKIEKAYMTSNFENIDLKSVINYGKEKI